MLLNSKVVTSVWEYTLSYYSIQTPEVKNYDVDTDSSQ